MKNSTAALIAEYQSTRWDTDTSPSGHNLVIIILPKYIYKITVYTVSSGIIIYNTSTIRRREYSLTVNISSFTGSPARKNDGANTPATIRPA